VPISGLNIAAAVPDLELAKSLQKAMASSDVSRSLARVASKRFAQAGISSELRRTMEEIQGIFASPATKEMVKTLGLPQMVATRNQQADVAAGAELPAADALRRQRP
jgi:hypothetical protein